MTLAIVLTWYLVIANPNGGLLSIPEPSQSLCITEAQHLNNYFRPLSNGTDAFCVYGLPKQ